MEIETELRAPASMRRLTSPFGPPTFTVRFWISTSRSFVPPPSPSRGCPALPDAGGVTEISRWSSEPGERTPPDQRHHSHAPRRGRWESSGGFRHPLRGAFVLRLRSGGVRSCLARPPANFLGPSGTDTPATARCIPKCMTGSSPSDSLGAGRHTRERSEQRSHEVSHGRRGEELSEFLLSSARCCGRQVRHSLSSLKIAHPSRIRPSVTTFPCIFPRCFPDGLGDKKAASVSEGRFGVCVAVEGSWFALGVGTPSRRRSVAADAVWTCWQWQAPGLRTGIWLALYS